MASCYVRAVCLSALLLLPSVANAAGDSDEKAGAQKTFEAGTKLYDAHRFKEALTALRASYQILPSPNSHLMVARCLRELGNYKEAYREFLAVAAEAKEKGDKYTSAAQAASDESEEVKQKLGFIVVRISGAPEGVKVKVGDETVDPQALGTPVPQDPATVVVTAEGSDGATARAEVTVAAGSTQTVELTLVPPSSPEAAPPPPAPEPPKVAIDTRSKGVPLRTWAYVAGGVGVAGLATFAIFGSMSNSKYNDLKDHCANGGACPANFQDEVDSGKTDQTIANIGLGVGIVGLGAGTVLFLLGGKKSDASEGQSASHVHVYLGTRSVAVRGSF